MYRDAGAEEEGDGQLHDEPKMENASKFHRFVVSLCAVGMNRHAHTLNATTTSIPRARGDEPQRR